MTAKLMKHGESKNCADVLSAFLGIALFLHSSGVLAQNNGRDFVWAPVVQNDGWSVADSTSAGLTHQSLLDLTQDVKAGEYAGINSVLISHRGQLVYEYYFDHLSEPSAQEHGRQDKRRIYSVTKSITSLLLGIVLQDNFEQALDRPVFDYFPDINNSDPLVSGITLEHALTMSAGLEWNEMDTSYGGNNDDDRMQVSKDPIKFVLSRPLTHLPGERWYYSGGLTMVVAGVAESLIDQSFEELAKEKLFTPLGITDYMWARSGAKGNTVNAGWGLRLRLRDLAKIGYLVLEQGRWQGQQLVPEKWIEASTRRVREDLRLWSGDGLYGYGFQWWHGQYTDSDGQFDAITGLGYGGQRLFIVPDEELVVAVYSSNYGDEWLNAEAILKRIVLEKR